MKKSKLKEKIEELTSQLGIANRTVAEQIKVIEMLNKQLDLQDKAIVRKDNQFLGLRKAFQDEIINKEN